MIRSMTAFVDGEITVDNLTILCELRSVNHRYSDVNIKLPERLRFLESDARHLIADKLKRGKIECSLNYRRQADSQHFDINLETVRKLLAATAAIESCMHNARAFSALDILAFPGVQQENEVDKDKLRHNVIALIDTTLDKLLEYRSGEGNQLAALISERCEKVIELVDVAHRRMPEVLDNLRNRLMSRVTELVAEPHFDRLEQELVLLAQKLDVAEELDRLQTHVAEVLRVLRKPEPQGRRLDFLMQEMNREANTLGSKSADREMTQISIDLKVLIEQMREQIQNIE
ncbi:MAG: YicC family protein [Methylomonas sp.]|nr:MAG: YicC family protein [Methylomonas sp.]PPD27663.1 MAG: YicC family protein [Methylomonas sp.]PPD39649.1 MAG: YicC family protein [Methylomonas sp.]PPD51681.1 MAG: YicC family protein [Methylomonas sp.]